MSIDFSQILYSNQKNKFALYPPLPHVLHIYIPFVTDNIIIYNLLTRFMTVDNDQTQYNWYF